MRDQRGISIAAHVTHKNGLLKALRGQARIRAWRDDNLLAIQIPGGVQDLPEDVRPIVENGNPDYCRQHAPESNLAIAVLNAGDVQSPADLDDPAATCWVKMSDVGIEGLRQAFLDPGSRIRLHSDPSIEEHAELLAMAWEGGFLDNTAVRFNPNLNVLVGGRGAGKSTVVESLRHVLGLDPLGEDARTIHRGIVRNVLRSGTKVSLLVRCHRPGPRDYRIERTIPNPPVVRDQETGEVLNVTATDVFPGVEIYGQHEISELTGSPEKLTRLLERFVERDDAVGARKQDLRQALEKSRRRILAAREERARIDERLAALPGLEETLKRYRDAGLEESLKEQSLLVREERVLDTVPERLWPFRSCLEELRQALPIDRTFVSARALEDLPGKEILADADGVLEELNRGIEDVAKALDAAIQRADEGIADVRERFKARRAEVQSAYEKKLRELQKARIDGEEFIRLRRRIEELRPLKERQSTLKRAEADEGETRRSLLAEWEDAKAGEFRALERAGKRVTRQLEGRVRVPGRVRGKPRVIVSVAPRRSRGEALRGDQCPAGCRQPVAGRVRAGLPRGCRRSHRGILHRRRAGGAPSASSYRGPDADRGARSSFHDEDRTQHRSLQTRQRAGRRSIDCPRAKRRPPCCCSCCSSPPRRSWSINPRTISTIASSPRASCRACARRSVAVSFCSPPTTRTSPCWETRSSFSVSARRVKRIRGAREPSPSIWAQSTRGRCGS